MRSAVVQGLVTWATAESAVIFRAQKTRPQYVLLISYFRDWKNCETYVFFFSKKNWTSFFLTYKFRKEHGDPIFLLKNTKTTLKTLTPCREVQF